jgi:hypothetical protein
MTAEVSCDAQRKRIFLIYLIEAFSVSHVLSFLLCITEEIAFLHVLNHLEEKSIAIQLRIERRTTGQLKTGCPALLF